MQLAGQRVLITGGTGFVGSHLAERLVRDGCRVRVLANYKSQPHVGNLQFTSPEIRQEMEIVWGDVCDRDSVTQACAGQAAVFHLAALIGIPYSYVAPASYVQTNVAGTLNVLQAVRSSGVERLMHTSTSETYGTARYTPMDESHPLTAQSPYAATKIAADKLVESFCHAFALPAVTVRPFNVYGPRQSDRAVIPTIISQALASGGEIRLGDPAPRRDFTFVTDTVEGFVRAAGCDQAIGRVLNLGSGQSISIGALAERIRAAIGGGRVVRDAGRIRPESSEVGELCCHNGLAYDVLGWAPSVNLATGLDRTIEFIRRHPEQFTPRHYAI